MAHGGTGAETFTLTGFGHSAGVHHRSTLTLVKDGHTDPVTVALDGTVADPQAPNQEHCPAEAKERNMDVQHADVRVLVQANGDLDISVHSLTAGDLTFESDR